MTDDTSAQGATHTSGHGSHLESVEVDTIDGHWVMPAEVEDGFAEKNRVLTQDTVGKSSHTEPVVVDTIDGHWVVPAEVEHGPGERRHILQQESTGAPVADELDAERNGFLRL